MRNTVRFLALALTVSTGALWAQTETTTQPSPVASTSASSADSNANTSASTSADSADPNSSATAQPPQSTEPAPDPAPNPPTATNPANQESDALPQSSVTPPVTEEPLPTAAPPAENPKPAEPAPAPKTDIASGSVVSSSASSLVIETMGGKLTFTVDSSTTSPALKAKDQVSVEYVTLADGSKHANRVTVSTPKKSAAVAAPRSTTPPAPKKPVAEPAAPIASQAVTPPATEPTPVVPAASEPAPAAEPLASGASSADTADSHTLSSDTTANPLATAKVARDYSPTRMIVPVVILLGGLLFITVLGVRQARREA